MNILALNCGSSSVRFAVFGHNLVATTRGQVENIADGLEPRLLLDDQRSEPLPGDLDTHAAIIAFLLESVIAASQVAIVGHRVVHGGTRFTGPAVIDGDVLGDIRELAVLAPSHQPHNIAGIDAVTRAMPHVPQVACFDTAFHRTIPEVRQVMALPRRFTPKGLRRFGFHGLSYESVVAQLQEMPRRTVICHLGNGCSIAGLTDGASAFTSMGFTPLDGLMMGRRPGRLDPGAVLWLVRHHDGDVAAVDRLLNREAGLLGVSGVSSDMRALLNSTAEEAHFAVAMFVDRLVLEIGSAVAAIGGIDALIFTGGIGQNAAAVRAAVIESLTWLAFRVDRVANESHAAVITHGRPAAHVIATDEERVIASSALRLVFP